jgi:hypothetical protein
MPIAEAAVACSVAFVCVVAVAALAVAAAGASDDARRALHFSFAGVERSPSAIAGITLHNARFAAGTLVCAGAFPRLGARTRALLDGLLVALLVLNAVAVGVAIGAYGTRVMSATALHLPIELGALSLAAGAYVQARVDAVSAGTLVAIAAGCALLLGAAATVETYVSGTGGPR